MNNAIIIIMDGEISSILGHIVVRIADDKLQTLPFSSSSSHEFFKGVKNCEKLPLFLFFASQGRVNASIDNGRGVSLGQMSHHVV